MKRQDGFTLLELLVGIVLTGVVAVLVYGAVNAAVDTAERLRAEELTVRSERAWRAVVEDAVRNVRENSDYGRPTLVVEQRVDAAGIPRDRLRLITAGSTPPLTSDTDWTVSIEPREGGVSLTAHPLGIRSPLPTIVELPGVTGLDVRVFGGAGVATWREEWSDRRTLPRAVELRYWTAGGPIGPPVVLAVPAGSP